MDSEVGVTEVESAHESFPPTLENAAEGSSPRISEATPSSPQEEDDEQPDDELGGYDSAAFSCMSNDQQQQMEQFLPTSDNQQEPALANSENEQGQQSSVTIYGEEQNIAGETSDPRQQTYQQPADSMNGEHEQQNPLATNQQQTAVATVTEPHHSPVLMNDPNEQPQSTLETNEQPQSTFAVNQGQPQVAPTLNEPQQSASPQMNGQQQQQQQQNAPVQLKPPPPPPPAAAAAIDNAEVIDLLDSDSDEENGKAKARPSPAQALKEAKRTRWTEESYDYNPRMNAGPNLPVADPRRMNINLMTRKSAYPMSNPMAYRPPNVGGPIHLPAQQPPRPVYPIATPQNHQYQAYQRQPQPSGPTVEFDKPQYTEIPKSFLPRWNTLLPQDFLKDVHQPQRKLRRFKLSLLNNSEFTITGLPTDRWGSGRPTPMTGLRVPIRRISKEHGKAEFEKTPDGNGRWRIPLGAYHPLVTFLLDDPLCQLVKIPQVQLKLATLGKARLEKNYPTPEELNKRGVPLSLAQGLAPFQRGGVDFALNRQGRALIADEMGLGKTVQGIAAMSVYADEWPLLVLCPSGARYHWECEFRNWLGEDGEEKTKPGDLMDTDEDGNPIPQSDSVCVVNWKPLENTQIHVLTSSKSAILPSNSTRVVICSYGLAPALAQHESLVKGKFRCAIADESHMLKNSKSKRTECLLPILSACQRCVLLSGTPALAKPQELWPQLEILKAGEHGCWENEGNFVDKYVKNGDSSTRAELHTLLTSTVMIRRLKNDILKTMLPKSREKAVISVGTPETRREMKECMEILRQGKGVMGKLARKHAAAFDAAIAENNSPLPRAAENAPVPKPAVQRPEVSPQTFREVLCNRCSIAASPAEVELESEIRTRYLQGQNYIQQSVTSMTSSNQLSSQAEVNNFVVHLDAKLRSDIQTYYRHRLGSLQNAGQGAVPDDCELSRTNALSKFYSLTGKSKVPAIVSMLKKWLADKTKGKICVFAHHISVLDEISEQVGLSTTGAGGTYKYIRIDGSTTPRNRQEQINAFQTDPTIRVALLGITAAGVAVTLTAASQVVFAELFWTPALMIQAEDRCHRIGQQARVHCLYFVAAGTLDDILWKLIEKKFRELGEFVEGKEKLKMVVHKVYKNEEELHSELYSLDDGGLKDETADASQVTGTSNEVDLQLDADLQREIEHFGQEEQAMVCANDEDEDDEDEDSKPLAINKNNDSKSAGAGHGSSHDCAIALSDTDSDDEEILKAVDQLESDTFNEAGTLPNCKFYRLWQTGSKFGFEVQLFRKRLVVSGIGKKRLARLGPASKPCIGDILVGVGDNMIAEVTDINRLVKAIQKVPRPLALCFIENAEFQAFYRKYLDENRYGSRTSQSSEPACPGEVIEVDD